MPNERDELERVIAWAEHYRDLPSALGEEVARAEFVISSARRELAEIEGEMQP